MSNKQWAKYWWNWGKDNLDKVGTPCGLGSTVESTRIIKDYIEKVVKSFDIKTVSDAPCGQYNLWMKDVDYGNAKYIGYDINDEIIKMNSEEFPKIEFKELDIVNEILPKTDLIICKDCLFHLTNDYALCAVNNFRKSGSKYLLCTNHNNIRRNKEIPEINRKYGFRELNIMLHPFNIGKPIEFLHEPMWKKEFCLWLL